MLVVLSPQLSTGATADPLRMLGAFAALGGDRAARRWRRFSCASWCKRKRHRRLSSGSPITSTLLGLATLPFGWVMPDPTTAALLVLSGILGGLGQILLTSSYRYADASLIAPFEYVSMLLAVLIGWFIFDEAPTATVLIGAALVIVAGILIIWRERQLGLQRVASAAMTAQS